MIQMKLKRQIGRKFHTNLKSMKILTYSRNSDSVVGQEDKERKGDIGVTKLNKRTASRKMRCIVVQGSRSVIPSWEVGMAEKLTP